LARGWLDTVHSSPDTAKRAHVRQLLDCLNPGTELVTVLDGHPLALAWMGAVRGTPVRPLGVKNFGASGSLADVYRMHDIDVEAIVNAATHS
jgi:pyruvate dehydrogenase E1 component